MLYDDDNGLSGHTGERGTRESRCCQSCYCLSEQTLTYSKSAAVVFLHSSSWLVVTALYLTLNDVGVIKCRTLHSLFEQKHRYGLHKAIPLVQAHNLECV
ncbi:Hypothetical predicted protein [Scomber scombrus]|uniref:Uncharacterized protein n=1 Tax=Scomber scombrus TaxID=13677 RepID=A0AAV1NIA0_SCOSC